MFQQDLLTSFSFLVDDWWFKSLKTYNCWNWSHPHVTSWVTLAGSLEVPRGTSLSWGLCSTRSMADEVTEWWNLLVMTSPNTNTIDIHGLCNMYPQLPTALIIQMGGMICQNDGLVPWTRRSATERNGAQRVLHQCCCALSWSGLALTAF